MNDPRNWTFGDWCNVAQKALPAFALVGFALLIPVILVAVLILWK